MVHARAAEEIFREVAKCEFVDESREDDFTIHSEEELTDEKEEITCRECVTALGGNPLYFDQRLRWRGTPDTTKRAL